MEYSIKPKDWIYVKGCGFFFNKNIGKNLSVNIDSWFSVAQKKSATHDFKTPSKEAIQKTAEATGDLTGNKIIERIARTGLLQVNQLNLQKQIKNQ